MIGCLILGTFAAMGVARFVHRHHGCGGRWGTHGGGGFGPPWRGMHAFHGDGHWGGGWRGGGQCPPDRENGWGGPEQGDEPQPGGGEGWDRFGYDSPPAGRGRARDFMGNVLGYVLNQVRATATQERVIRAAFDEFREEMKDVGGGERKKTRQDISAALRKPQFDEVFMGELFARQDTAIERTRKAFVGLMLKVHEALDEEQRGRLADLVEKGPRFFRRGFDW